VREGSPTHGSRRGLSSTAPIGAVEPFSEYGIYATNLRYMTLGSRVPIQAENHEDKGK
jgi:hypothetical protein